MIILQVATVSLKELFDEVAIQSAQWFRSRVGGLAVYISILGLIPILSLGLFLSVVFDLDTDELTWLIYRFSVLVGLAEDLIMQCPAFSYSCFCCCQSTCNYCF